MKLTKESLKRIIKEELDTLLDEAKYEGPRSMPGGSAPNYAAYDEKRRQAQIASDVARTKRETERIRNMSNPDGEQRQDPKPTPGVGVEASKQYRAQVDAEIAEIEKRLEDLKKEKKSWLQRLNPFSEE